MKKIFEGEGKLSQRPSVVFDPYPAEPSQFSPDLVPHVQDIIEAHGPEEWKAAILTHEMHRHLGVYSILGVKMGILARELLNTGMDSIRVVAYTGLEPPLSCMVDGLQVATGASLGRGAITIAEDTPPRTEALFIHEQTRLKLSLKPIIRDGLEARIDELASQFSSDSAAYFREVRKLSLKCWLEYNRNDIFEAVHFVERLKKVN